MKKGLKFTKEKLEDLYLKQKLSLSQIGKKYNCNSTNIFYWLKRFDIKRRPAYFKKVDIPKEILHDLYHNQKFSSLEIANKLKSVNPRTIRKKLKKFGIQTRSLSEALTKKFKAPFIENPIEKAFFLGLRTGDFYAKQKNISVRLQTSSTHQAQINLLKDSFKNYGETKVYLSKPKNRGKEWFIYTDLHPSFSFLLEKPTRIPFWILDDNKFFYSFLSAYSDCEGNWHLTKSHGKHLRVTYRLRTGDKIVLEQIKDKLKDNGFSPILTLGINKGTKCPSGRFKIDIYDLILNKKSNTKRLINKLLPYSKHSEKVRKMNFILENFGKTWEEIEIPWNKLREEIKNEILNSEA